VLSDTQLRSQIAALEDRSHVMVSAEVLRQLFAGYPRRERGGASAIARCGTAETPHRVNGNLIPADALDRADWNLRPRPRPLHATPTPTGEPMTMTAEPATTAPATPAPAPPALRVIANRAGLVAALSAAAAVIPTRTRPPGVGGRGSSIRGDEP
jgi:hypothetical protein